MNWSISRDDATPLVGPAARGLIDEPFGSARGRALDDCGVAAVLLDPSGVVPKIVWANESFHKLTGHPPESVVGIPLSALEGAGATPFDFSVAAAATSTGSLGTPVPWRMRIARADGEQIWCEYTVAPVPRDTGESQPWLALVTDVSDQVRAQTEHEVLNRNFEAAKVALHVSGVIPPLLADLENATVFHEMCAAFQPQIFSWCGFFLDDAGLRFAVGLRPGVDGSDIPHTPGQDTDALGDAQAPGESVGAGCATFHPDPIRDLLDGVVQGPLDFELRADYPSGSTAAWLSAQVLERSGNPAPGPEGETLIAQVRTIPGRREALGLFVTLAPGAEGVAMDPATWPATIAALVIAMVRGVGARIDAIRLCAREQSIGHALQRAMLPERVEVSGLDVWTYYAPTPGGPQAGGDWYDVVQLDEEIAGLVIGDVVGHDIEAAATMGQLRSIVRSLALERIYPGPVLERVDHLVAGMRVSRSASLIYGTLHRTTGPSVNQETVGAPGERPARWSFEYSRAGHLPPLHIRNGKVAQLDGAGGALVGFGEGPRASAVVSLEPGDSLIFYTDGLIERRDRSMRAGLAALIDTCAQIVAKDAAGIGEELLAGVGEPSEDDVAVVVVRVPDPVADSTVPNLSPRSRRWLLPSEPASLGRARHAVVRTCQAWELGNVANAELVVSELVANGVLHGWGHISLRLFDTGDGLRIEVEDSNPAPPVTTDGHANRLGGYGMQIVERLADWGWYPSGAGKLVWAKMRPTVSIDE